MKHFFLLIKYRFLFKFPIQRLKFIKYKLHHGFLFFSDKSLLTSLCSVYCPISFEIDFESLFPDKPKLLFEFLLRIS